VRVVGVLDDRGQDPVDIEQHGGPLGLCLEGLEQLLESSWLARHRD
jgi:hypothetical protein